MNSRCFNCCQCHIVSSEIVLQEVLAELEQELACNESLTDSFNRVETLLAHPQTCALDKLRLVLLYSLR